MKYLSIILVSLVFIYACQSEHSAKSSNYDSAGALALEEEISIEPPRTAETPAPAKDKDIPLGSKIIKTAELGIEVGQLESAKQRINELLSGFNAYYENERYQSSSYNNTYHLKIRVPNASFDSLMSAILSGEGKLLSKSVQAKDVTEEYLDLNIRLKNKLSYLEQYRALLKRSKTTKELLEIQEEIRALEEEIESKKGRIRFLDSKVMYSTINLQLVNNIVQKRVSITYLSKLKDAFGESITGVKSFSLVLVRIWPLLLIVILLFVGRKRIFSKFKGNKADS